MSTAVKRQVSAKQAEAMWEDLKGLFVNAEKKIVEIIEAKAWEPLGYDSFSEAWQTRMAGVRLSSELRVHVVYAMFDEGLSETEVNDRLGLGSGIGSHTVKSLKQQRSNGVPPSLASVRAHVRKLPGAAQTIHVQFPADEYSEFKRLATLAGRDVVSISHEAIKAAFEDMDR